MTPILNIVVPCYNEEEVLPETIRRLTDLLQSMFSLHLVSEDSLVLFVDDGSHDQTWTIIEHESVRNMQVHGIKLSRNQGHQNALMAGLEYSKGDIVVSVDADLQDDINVIVDMVKKYSDGSEIVYGVRKRRDTDTLFKRNTASIYYKLLAAMGVEVVYNHADFRLMSRKALSALKSYSEVNLFLRGVIPMLGFSATTVYYDRVERFAGASKYPIRRMIALALDGVTSFSVMPLRIISLLGLLACGFSSLMITWILVGKFFMDAAIPGWASSVIPIYFLGGVQLLSTGVLGEYVAKVYLETKRRPRYIVEKIV